MNFNWNTEQEGLRAKFAAFGREVVAPRAAACSAANVFDRESWDELAASGFWELVVPVEHSGRLKSDARAEAWWNFTAAAEGLASESCDGGFLLSVIGQAGVIRSLDIMGSPEQQAAYFPRLLKGALAATCIAERHGGTDLGGVETELSGKEGDWRLNGEKWNISHAPDAEILLVAARIKANDRFRLSTLLLNSDQQGVSQGNPEQKMGNRSLPTGWLRFEGTRVGQENILGAAGRLDALQSAASLQRIYYGLLGALLPSPIFRRTESFLKERSSMGRPLTQHQYVQGRLTQALLLREQATWTCRAALGKLLEGHPEAMMLSSMAKITGSEAAIGIARELTSLLGSEGYLDDAPSRILRDVLAWVAVGGTEEAHRINIYHQFNRRQKTDHE